MIYMTANIRRQIIQQKYFQLSYKLFQNSGTLDKYSNLSIKMKFLSLSLFSAMISITFEKGMNEYLLVKIHDSQEYYTF